MKNMLSSLIGNVRGLLMRGVVQSVNDAGAAQTVTVTTGTGVTRGNVEVLLPFGFSCVPPADGAICLVFSLGADPANMMALPISNPSVRMGDLAAGEAVLYGADGSRVHIRSGGIVDVWGGAQVNIHTKTSTINVPDGATVNGNFTINGNLVVSGTVQTGNVSVEGNLTASGTVSDNHATL